MSFIEVFSRQGDGCIGIYDAQGTNIAIKLRGGTVCDLREAPPYLAMSPCPYCCVTGDRDHDPVKHIDPFLGRKNQ